MIFDTHTHTCPRFFIIIIWPLAVIDRPPLCFYCSKWYFLCLKKNLVDWLGPTRTMAVYTVI